jgi:hypothetical protein
MTDIIEMRDEREYRDDGIAFQYPVDWEVARERKSGELSITLNGPGTAFATLMVLFDRPGAATVVDAALDTFEAEYPDMDVHTVRTRLCDRPAVAKDIEFFCHQLTNTARLRAFDTEHCTVVLLCQVNDGELADVEPVFDRFAETLSITESEMGFDDADEDDADEDFDEHFRDADRSDAPRNENRRRGDGVDA